MVSDNIFNSDMYKRLQEIEQRRTSLSEVIEKDELATPEIKSAYEIALSHLGESVITLAQDPDLQGGYALYGLEAVQGMEQLEPLKDILPAEQIQPIESDLRNRIEKARDFFTIYGTHIPEAQEFLSRVSVEELAVATAVDITPVPPLDEALIITSPEHAIESSEADHERVPLTITVRHGIVKIGKQGKSYKLSSTTSK